MRELRFLELWATGGAAITRRSSIVVADPRVTADGNSSASLAGKRSFLAFALTFSLRNTYLIRGLCVRAPIWELPAMALCRAGCTAPPLLGWIGEGTLAPLDRVWTNRIASSLNETSAVRSLAHG